MTPPTLSARKKILVADDEPDVLGVVALNLQRAGFDVLKAISEQGNDNGEPKVPVIITGGGSVPKSTHPREFLKAMEKPKLDEHPEKKVMRYSSTYRHTGLIGH